MMRPLRDKVLLVRLPEEKTTKSGIWLQSDKPEKSNLIKAIVLDVGPGAENRPPAAVKRGDLVAANRYTAELFWLDQTEYVVVNSPDIIVNLTGSAESLPEGFVEKALATYDAHANPPVEEGAAAPVNDGQSEAAAS